jgi:hypothetical protein
MLDNMDNNMMCRVVEITDSVKALDISLAIGRIK